MRTQWKNERKETIKAQEKERRRKGGRKQEEKDKKKCNREEKETISRKEDLRQKIWGVKGRKDKRGEKN